MIILDSALQRRADEGNPIRIGIVGAGYIARGLTLQINEFHTGMRVCGISNRNIDAAGFAFKQAGVEKIVHANSGKQIDDAINKGVSCVTNNPDDICESELIEVIIEATGEIDFGAKVCLKAFECQKHVVLMNAELDATIGPILQVYAKKAGVVVTNADGDQPGVIMNLFRYVQSIGFKPVLAGNMKGLQDPYRTPETQRAFAETHKQKPHMVTSFADGSKISMEMAVVANATGFRVGKRGMYGHKCERVEQAVDVFDHKELLQGGIVDYVLGAQPGGGVFVIGHCDNPVQTPYMKYYKMGDGPFYVFYTPYHLPHIEGGLTAARAVLFEDAATKPLAGPVAEVFAVAKCEIEKGEKIDYIGGFKTYGVLDNSDTVQIEKLLPLGLANDCIVIRDIPKDAPLTLDDVTMPEGRLCDRLWEEQLKYFN
ncbi:MAG: NAD(P)-dependent oxidoreductase [Pseudomonadota bacterium]